MSFLRKGIFVSGGQVLGIFLNMLAGILLARSLGPGGTGQFELFRSTQIMVVTFAGFGIGNACIYFLNNRKVEPECIVTNTLKAAAVFGLLLAVGLMIAIIRCHNYFGRVSLVTAVWFGIGSSCLLITALLKPVLVAQMAAKRMVAVDISTRLIMLIGCAIMFVFHFLSPQMAMILLASGNIAACILLLFYLRKHIYLQLPFDWRLFFDLIGYGLKLSAANLLYVLSYNITVILLRYMNHGDFTSVGLYTRAVGLSGMVTMIPVAIGPLLYAKWSGLGGKSRARQVEMVARLNIAFGFAACMLLLLGGEILIRLLYGTAFLEANQALQILAPSLIFMTLFGVSNNLLASSGRAVTTAYILAGTLCVISVVSWLGIPLLGIRGTALAVLCGNAFTATAGMIVCSRLYGIRLHRCLLLSRHDLQFMLQSLRRSSSSKVTQEVEAIG